MRNGVLYGITNWSVVFAVDARTGKETLALGSGSEPDGGFPQNMLRRSASRSRDVSEPDHRSHHRWPASSAGRGTGKVVWEARVAYPQDNYTVTMAPRIAKGKVIVGVSGRNTRCADSSRPSSATAILRGSSTRCPGDPSKPFENAAMKGGRRNLGPRSVEVGRRRHGVGRFRL